MALSKYPNVCVIPDSTTALLLHPLSTVLKSSHSIIPNDEAIYTSPTEGLTVPLKISAVVGLVIALPVVLWQVWSFVSPGLRPKERKLVGPFIGSALAPYGWPAPHLRASSARDYHTVGGFSPWS